MVADDRTIAPSPARWRHAWQAGLRWRSRWLWPAIGCAGLALLLDVTPASPGAWGLVSPASSLDAGIAALGWLGVPWLLAGVLVVLIAVIGRRLGPVSAVARRRLGAAPPTGSAGLSLVLGVVATGVTMLGLDGVLAGAARAVDASEAGLGTLWSGWAATGTAVLAGTLGVLTLAELVLDRRERGARLRQSPQQVREQARASGGR